MCVMDSRSLKKGEIDKTEGEELIAREKSLRRLDEEGNGVAKVRGHCVL